MDANKGPNGGQDLPLRGFDEECRKLVLDQYRLRGVTVHTSCSPSKLTKSSDGSLSVEVKPKQGESFTVDKVHPLLINEFLQNPYAHTSNLYSSIQPPEQGPRERVLLHTDIHLCLSW